MSHKYAKPRSDEEKKEIYDKWKKLINMSQNALDEWAVNDHRLLASINRSKAKEEGGIQSGYDSFHRIKRRKQKPFDEWSAQDFDNASQENGFNSRMLGGEPGEEVGGSGMSKWEISLKNWGHDPSLKSSPQHAKWKAWKMRHTKKSSIQRVVNRHLSKVARLKAPKKLLGLADGFFKYFLLTRYLELVEEGKIEEPNRRAIRQANRIVSKLKSLKSEGTMLEQQKFSMFVVVLEESDFPYPIPLDLEDLVVQFVGYYDRKKIIRGVEPKAVTRVVSGNTVQIEMYKIDSLALKFNSDFDVLEEISRSVQHELIHYVQIILQRRTDPNAGKPKKKERTPEYQQGGSHKEPEVPLSHSMMTGFRLDHLLDDVEFFPFVNDFINNFMKTLTSGFYTEVTPDVLEKYFKLFNSERHLESATRFPGSLGGELKHIEHDLMKLFYLLKHAPRKHARVMKELKKELKKLHLL